MDPQIQLALTCPAGLGYKGLNQSSSGKARTPRCAGTSRQDGGARMQIRPTMMVVVFLLALMYLFAPTAAEAASCSTCGGPGQRACCTFPIDGDGLTPCSTCESGLLKILGCDPDGDCGFLDCSLHTCYTRSACGADG